jgi:cytochrome c peroxidase
VRSILVIAALATLVALGAGEWHRATAKKGGGLAPLNQAAVPTSPEIGRFIRDAGAARTLGKALFWDMQAGSDGRTACASCHYAAGADSRSRNQLNPHGGGFAGKGPNAQLDAADFPVTSDNVVGSQGVLPSTFKDVLDGDALDSQLFAPTDGDFHVGGVNVRRTTGRNTPSAVNAVFNFRNFWDGRAQNDFNGVNPFGARDAGARVGHVAAGGGVEQIPIKVTNASLASQAVGPPGNPVEMSADGRTLSDIGRKLLTLRPLGAQQVSARDSVLGDLVAAGHRGLDTSYGELIRRAFKPEWWDGTGAVTAPNGRSYSLMQFNFALFWGLAIQSYESTLVSDQTPYDRFLNGEPSALSAQAQQGLSVFAGKGDCTECHNGAALTDATAANIVGEGPITVDARGAHDTGFHYIGVRPVASDAGNGGSDPFGNPLSLTTLAGQGTAGVTATFKTPGLRNVALTAPYFHNGSRLTLRQVVDFYSIGGEFPGELANLSLSGTEKDALVAFLESLTDPRVRDQAAPFDHPQLFVPAGEQSRADGSVMTDAEGRAVDCFKELPVTGAAGGTAQTRFPAFSGPPCDTPPSGDGGGPPDTALGDAPAAVTVRVPNVTLPGRSCSSRRSFSIRLRAPRRDRIRRVTVTVNGHKARDLRGRSLRRAPVDLRGLPRGIVRVRILVRTAKGRETLYLKRYRTCTKRR